MIIKSLKPYNALSNTTAKYQFKQTQVDALTSLPNMTTVIGALRYLEGIGRCSPSSIF